MVFCKTSDCAAPAGGGRGRLVLLRRLCQESGDYAAGGPDVRGEVQCGYLPFRTDQPCIRCQRQADFHPERGKGRILSGI